MGAEGREFESHHPDHFLIGDDMKALISDNGDYRVFAEVNEYLRSNGDVQLSFHTQWVRAKNPDEEHTKFRMILSPAEIDNLKKLLNESKPQS